MDIQIGYSNGYNTLLNDLEYHRFSEIHITANDIILLIAKQNKIDPCVLVLTINSSKIRAFLVPAGTGVEMHTTTTHFKPRLCSQKRTPEGGSFTQRHQCRKTLYPEEKRRRLSTVFYK
jgi:hypothetical protein